MGSKRGNDRTEQTGGRFIQVHHVERGILCVQGRKACGAGKNIGNELADIFGQLIRIADCYGIDLEEAHAAAREEEDRDLKSRGV